MLRVAILSLCLQFKVILIPVTQVSCGVICALLFIDRIDNSMELTQQRLTSFITMMQLFVEVPDILVMAQDVISITKKAVQRYSLFVHY